MSIDPKSSDLSIIEDFEIKNNIFLGTNENIYRRLKSKLNFKEEDVKIWIALFQESSNSHLPCIIYTPEEKARENLYERLAYFLNSARIPSDKGLVGQAFTAFKENKKNEAKNCIYSVYDNEKNSISVVDFILDNRWWLAVPFPRKNPRMVFSLTNSNYNDEDNPWDETQLREVELILKDYEPEYLLLREKILFHNSISAIEREIKQDFKEVSERTVCNFISGLSKELLKHAYLDYEAEGRVSTYYNTDLLENMIASRRETECSLEKCSNKNSRLLGCLRNEHCGLKEDALTGVFRDLKTNTMILKPGPPSHSLRLFLDWIPKEESDLSTSTDHNLHETYVEEFKLGLCCDGGCLTCDIMNDEQKRTCKDVILIIVEAMFNYLSGSPVLKDSCDRYLDFLVQEIESSKENRKKGQDGGINCLKFDKELLKDKFGQIEKKLSGQLLTMELLKAEEVEKGEMHMDSIYFKIGEASFNKIAPKSFRDQFSKDRPSPDGDSWKMILDKCEIYEKKKETENGSEKKLNIVYLMNDSLKKNDNSFEEFLKIIKTKAEGAFKELDIFKKNKELQQANKKTAIASVMARNMSHNIGSHVISRMVAKNQVREIYNISEEKVDTGNGSKTVLEYFPKNRQFEPHPSLSTHLNDAVSTFNSYLKSRMDFLADITTSIPVMEGIKWLHKDLLVNFYKNRILLDRISGISGFKFEIIPRFLSRKEEEKCKTACKEECRECIIEQKNDIAISIPNDVLGYHAFYVILENFIRNSAKHGRPKRKETLRVFIDFIEHDDFYEVQLFDDSDNGDEEEVHKLVKEINTKIKKSITDDRGELSPGNWGLIEMNAAAAYLRKVPSNEIDNPKYAIPDLYEEDYSEFRNPSGQNLIFSAFPKYKKYLAYRYFLLKPKEVLLIDDAIDSGLSKKERKRLGKIGISVCRKGGLSETTMPYPHKTVLFSGPENPDSEEYKTGTLSRRKFVIKNPDDLKDLLLSDSIKSLNSVLWNRIYKSNLQDTLDKYKLDTPPVNLGTSSSNDEQRLEFYYDNHGKAFLNIYSPSGGPKYSYIEITNSLTKGYIGRDIAIRSALFESIITRIMVIDERIQEYAETGTYKPQDQKEDIPVKDIYRATNVLVPDSEEDCNLNEQKFESGIWDKIRKYFQNGYNTWNDSGKGGKFNFDFCIIHLGVLEKSIAAFNRENTGQPEIGTDSTGIEFFIKKILISDSEMINEIYDRIIVVSGRGQPHNLPTNIRYLNYSIVSQYLIEIRFKLLLTQAVYSARQPYKI